MHRIFSFIAVFVFCVGLLVVMGWIFDVAWLKSFFPGLPTMKSATALSFMLSGLILFFAGKKFRKSRDDWSNVVLPVVSLALLLLMGVTLLSVLFDFYSGIEIILFQFDAGSILTVVPGLPSIGTMIAFFLVGILGILALFDAHVLRVTGYRILGLAIAVIAFLALLGFLFDVPLLYYAAEDISGAMALHTAILFLLLGVGFVLLTIPWNGSAKRLKKRV